MNYEPDIISEVRESVTHWCPPCSVLLPQGTTVCPLCGKPVTPRGTDELDRDVRIGIAIGRTLVGILLAFFAAAIAALVFNVTHPKPVTPKPAAQIAR